MNPFKLTPAFKDNLWGGRKLITHFDKQCDFPVLAESWELSAHPAGSSMVATGAHTGTPFADLVRTHPEICGSACAKAEEFPILIKFIDAQQTLSVQVHPNDVYARKHEGEFGKNEMWVILDNEPGAFLYFGFTHEISRTEMERRIADNTLTEVLHKAPVQPGDVFFIRAGTIHAIGAGIVLAEVQQNSNSTYRVFDFGRRDTEGNPRELHIQKALEVTSLTPADPTPPGAQPPMESEQYTLQRLTKSAYFTVDRLLLHGTYAGVASTDSFVSLLSIDGTATFNCGQETQEIAKGESVFLPAGSGAYTLSGNGTYLLTQM